MMATNNMTQLRKEEDSVCDIIPINTERLHACDNLSHNIALGSHAKYVPSQKPTSYRKQARYKHFSIYLQTLLFTF